MEIQTTVGLEDKQPNDVDIIVSYDDRWGWDYVFYLRDLKITMVDQKTKSVISSGNFENHALFFFHKYPDPKESVHGLIQSIFSTVNKPSA